MPEYLNGLNEAQRNAVLATEGPVQVIAGAGSGKTRVLTMRIAHLLQQGVKPWNILALTFTNKAAREMKERIASIVGPNLAQQLWMGTFHSVFAKILRMEAQHIGFNSDFTIYDTPDTKQTLHKIIKELNLDSSDYKDSAVLNAISTAKNDLVFPNQYSSVESYIARDKNGGRAKMAEVYSMYMNMCRQSNAMDFDDLLMYTNVLFKEHPEILAKYQDKFIYTLVDEYQDTNHAQYNIVRRLVEKYKNICVVGDDAQSIYSFRGARIENILRFRNDYPNHQIFKLEQNYRSTQMIVNAANSLITHNVSQIPKTIFSEGDEGEKLRIHASDSDKEQAVSIVSNIIGGIRHGNNRPADFAILYRNHAQTRELEESLRKAGIAYKIFGGISFYQREEIKDLLAYCRLAVNPRDHAALRRVFNKPKRGIGDTTQDKIESYAMRSGMPMWDVICSTPNMDVCGISGPTQKKIQAFAAMIWNGYELSRKTDAHTLMRALAEKSGILQEFMSHKDDPDVKDKLNNIFELLDGVSQFVSQQNESNESNTMDTYLQEISLMTSEDKADMDKSITDFVSLMTIHASKGLEFNNVIISGMEDEKFPGLQSTMNASELEEERRLFYVAITRARKEVDIYFSRRIVVFGQFKDGHPSRFLKDIDSDFIDDAALHSRSHMVPSGFRRPEPPRPSQSAFQFPKATPRPAASSAPSFRPAPKPSASASAVATTIYHVGERIVHDTFGRGEVIATEGRGLDTKLTIKFDNGATKHLLLKFARIRKI
ncbi:MAG: UvrD-helicase domain-containing protein [Bacteroidia bacterium]|nr:UvrD-helicase domain-containing protein [Bacteroidia bacterium]